MDLGWYELSLDVQDITRSCEFYEKLGFERLGHNVEERTATVQRGNCRLGLYQGRAPEPILIFWQGDVAAIVDDLKRKGLTFEKELADEKGLGALTRDPDGQAIYFVNIRGETRSGPPSKGDRALGWFVASLAVKYLERSVAFYEKLGFQSRPREIEGVAMMGKGDCAIGLYQGHIEPDKIQLTFWQGDVGATTRQFAANGLSFLRGPSEDAAGGKGAVLQDPDGHIIHLINEARLRRTAPAA